MLRDNEPMIFFLYFILAIPRCLLTAYSFLLETPQQSTYVKIFKYKEILYSCLQAIIKITPSYLSLSDDEKEIQNKFYVGIALYDFYRMM